MAKIPYSLQSFATYTAKYKWRFIFVALLFVISSALMAIVPIFIGKLVGVLATQPVDSHKAWLYASILIGSSALHDITWRLAEYTHMKFLLPVQYRYENIIFSEIIKKPYPFFVDKFTGKLSSYINTTSSEFREFIETILYNYIDQVVSLIAVTVILATVNWQTGAIFAAGLLLMILAMKLTIGKTIKYEKIFTDVQSSKNGKIIDSIANFVNVKSFHKESAEIESIKVEQNKTLASATKSFAWSLVFWTVMSFIIRELIWPATIVLNVYFYLHGQITIAELTTFFAAITMFSNFIWGIIWNISRFNLKIARIEEAHGYLFGKVNIVKKHFETQNRDIVKRDFRDNLRLHDLTFAYPDKKDTIVLNGINLEIKKGEKLGIVGRSGSGKTTLAKLLLGYYPSEKWQIFMDGEEIDTRDLASLISYVPQDTSLFHRTISENIAYASDNKVTREDIIEASKKAHADEFITRIKGKYDALVGERGVKLSAGQRQRIAIARAFLDGKPILILDEATSALDSESEVLVQDALEALWEEKTVIAIAHRLSTLRHMDRIIVMDKSKIVEQGNHNELIKKNGIYAKLWNHQSGDFLDES